MSLFDFEDPDFDSDHYFDEDSDDNHTVLNVDSKSLNNSLIETKSISSEIKADQSCKIHL